MKNSSTTYLPENATAIGDGVFIAPSNYCIAKDVVLGDGSVIKKGKKIFTLAELNALKLAGELPEGWDIPTRLELEAVVAKYGTKRGTLHVHNLMTSLGLSLEGSLISSDFDRYNNDPSIGDSCVIGRNTLGHYLCTDVDDPAIPWMLFLNDSDSGIYVAPCDISATGSVRLVYRATST